MGRREKVVSQLRGWNFAITYTVAQGRPIHPGYGNPGCYRLVGLVQVAERAKAYAASANGPGFAAETDRWPTLYVVDPKGAFKHAWTLQVRTTDALQGRVLLTWQCVLFMVLPGHALQIPDQDCGLPQSRSGSGDAPDHFVAPAASRAVTLARRCCVITQRQLCRHTNVRLPECRRGQLKSGRSLLWWRRS